MPPAASQVLLLPGPPVKDLFYGTDPDLDHTVVWFLCRHILHPHARLTQRVDDWIVTVPRQTDNLIRHPCNQGQQGDTQQDPDNLRLCSNKETENNADDHDEEQKTCTTALMLFGTFSDIFHIQFQSMLDTVDTLVFRSMIHKCPLDVLRP